MHKFIYILFFIPFFSLLNSSLLSAQPQKNTIEGFFELYQKGKQKHETFQGNQLYEQAIDYWASIDKDSISDQHQREYSNCLARSAITKLKLSVQLKRAQKQAEQALTMRKELGEIYKKEGVHRFDNVLGVIYHLLGQIYQKQGDFFLAQKYFGVAESHYKKWDSLQHFLNKLENDLATLFEDMGQYKKAIGILQSILDKKPVDEEVLSDVYTNLGINYDDLGAFQTAISHYEKALAYTTDSTQIASLYQSISVSYKKLHLFQEAFKYLAYSKSIHESSSNQQQRSWYTDYHNNTGDVYLEMKQLDSALHHHHLALVSHLNTFTNHDVFTNPDEALKAATNKPDLLIWLESKAKTAYTYYLQNGNKKHLDLALDTYKKYDLTVLFLRREHATDEDRLEWIGKTRKVFAHAINAAYTAKKPELVLHFAESSRAVLLMEQLRHLDASFYSQIPDSLFAKERDLKYQIATANDSARLKLNHSMNKLYENFHQLDPKFFDLKFAVQPVSIKDIRSKLGKEKSLVAFFQHETELFTIAITQDTILVKKNTFEKNLLANIIDYKTTILSPNSKNYDYFLTEVGFSIYQQILQPIMPFLTDEVVFIPDNILHGFPFKALVTRPCNVRQGNYAALPYLIKEKAISNANSAKTFTQSKQKTTEKLGETLGIAPSDYSIYKLAALSKNKEEVQTIIDQSLNSKGLYGQAASKKNFLQSANLFKILLFATHATSYDSTAQEPVIYFQDKIMTLNELYKIGSLNADLAIISACQTAKGRHYEGEGVMSFARGFAYLGVPSVLTTLEIVDDNVAMKISTGFYRQLKKGRSKNKALQIAMLELINNQNDKFSFDFAKPCNWAPFILVGNTSPIFSGKNYWWLVLVIIVCSVALVTIQPLFFRSASGKAKVFLGA